MYTCTALSLRRKGGAYLWKYLEGVPTPSKLIDHLAGADLSSSPIVEFFTTVPRYISYSVEQRLSKLFFHHVLYPAGGARMPYQPVIVRNGRLTKISSTYKLHFAKNKEMHIACKDEEHVSSVKCDTPVIKMKKENYVDLSNSNVEHIPKQTIKNKANVVLGQIFSSPLDVIEDNGHDSGGGDVVTYYTNHDRCSNERKYNNIGEHKRDAVANNHTIHQERQVSFTSTTNSAISNLQWSRYDVARRPFFISPRLPRSSANLTNKVTYNGEYEMAEPLFNIYKLNKCNRRLATQKVNIDVNDEQTNNKVSNVTLHNNNRENWNSKLTENGDNNHKNYKDNFLISQCNSLHNNKYTNVLSSNNTYYRNQINDKILAKEDGKEKICGSIRGVYDSVLMPLCGVINESFNDVCERVLTHKENISGRLLLETMEKQKEEEEEEEEEQKKECTTVEQVIGSLLVNSSGGVLCAAINKETGNIEMTDSYTFLVKANLAKHKITSNSLDYTFHAILREFVRHAASLHCNKTRKYSNTFCHVMTYLPPHAITAIPISSSQQHLERYDTKEANSDNDNKNEKRETDMEFICRLAGGVEPHVPFAVGRAMKCHLNSSTSVNDAKVKLFSHINCLLRVNINVSDKNYRYSEHLERELESEKSDCKNNSLQSNSVKLSREEEEQKGHKLQNKMSERRISEEHSCEPWRLGTALDPLLPFQVRTMYEKDNLSYLTNTKNECTTENCHAKHCCYLNNNNNNNNYQDNNVNSNHHPSNQKIHTTVNDINKMCKRTDSHNTNDDDDDDDDDDDGGGGEKRGTDNCIGKTNSRTKKSAEVESSTDPLTLLLGRTDAETYLIPQRELIVTLYVPQLTKTMCESQNSDRLRLQAELGHIPKSYINHSVYTHNNNNSDYRNNNEKGKDSIAWTSHAKLTASRLAKGRFANIASAEDNCTKCSAFSLDENKSLRSNNINNENNKNGCDNNNNRKNWKILHTNVLEKLTSYEVRALPGDVVYIPRNWGFRVHRIVGSAVYGVDEALNKANTPHMFSNTSISWGNLSGNFTRSSHTVNHSVNQAFKSRTSTSSEQGQKGEEMEEHEQHHVSIASVEVEAFCLSYQPYPQLTKEQASVYVSANYVTQGIDEFYSNGGNSVYHKYE